jgi:peptidoglycan hydrolase-like protein with peptidoglycan-binding domain
MSRIILVPSDSPILEHETTEVLTVYEEAGEVLVRTEAPEAEARGAGPPHGLQVAGVSGDQLRELQGRPLGESAQDLLAYVELAGPPTTEWLARLRAAGVTPLRFQPATSYLCRGTGPQLDAVRELNVVVSVTPLAPEIKPTVRPAEAGETDVWIVVEGAADPDRVQARLAAIEGVALLAEQADRTPTRLRLAARLAGGDALREALRHPFVVGVEERRPVVPEDEVAGLVLAGQYDHRRVPYGSYLRWLEAHGLNGRGVAIGINDNGVDEQHEAFAGRITTRDGGRDWHGTFVAGHAAGNYAAERDADGFVYGLGTAPAAEIISQDNGDPASASCREVVRTTGPSGAAGTIQNNSWGVGTDDPMDYRSLEARYDEMVRNADPDGDAPRPLTLCFSAGNAGAAGLTRPKAAKNVIVTGNSENHRPDSPGGSNSDNIDEVYAGPHGSSHGNCADGRVRPHVVAPGEWTASANFDSHPGDREYISDRLTWGGGTSGASPKTAGACALLTQWWRDHNGGTDPSPALLRALIVNGAEDTGFGGPVPNPRQGWGRLHLANVLSTDVHHVYVDQSVLLRRRGEERRWRLRVSDPTMPLRVTLAWTDPPGPVVSGTADVPAVVNVLGLRVETAGETYHGNNFRGGWSRPGPLDAPAREGWDNLQNVYLPPGLDAPTFDVVVRALTVTTNCQTGTPTDPQQDFALVVTNGFIDQGHTPSDVFVVVDDTSAGSSSSLHDHWDHGSSDADEDDVDWWADQDDRSDPASPGPGRPTLRRGDRGDDVRALQRLLRATGHLSGPADGAYGPGTQRAVRAFQAAHGLTADGVAGPQTWRALEAATQSGGGDGAAVPGSPRPTLRPGDRGDEVRALQRLLATAGYLDGPADGIYGSGTRRAVRAVQADHGLATDGVAGPRTWEALDEATGAEPDGAATGGALASDDTDWWTDASWDDDEWGEAESAPHGPEADPEAAAASRTALVEGFRSGLSCSPPEPGVRLLRPDPSETSRDEGLVPEDVAAGSPEALRTALQHAAAPGLRDGLRRIMRHWSETAADEPRRRSTVIVVGDRTRVSRGDLRMLRRLATQGTLYVLSPSESILRFLAQRLHRTRGVQYRRCSRRQIDSAARAVAAEAAGAQALVLDPQSRTLEDGRAAVRVRFHLVEADRHVVLDVPGRRLAALRVKPPAGADFVLEGEARRDGVALEHWEQSTRVRLRRDEESPWRGEWRMEAVLDGDEAGPAPIGWVWSDLTIRADGRLDAQGRSPERDAAAGRRDGRPRNGRDAARPRLTVEGEAGTTLARVRVHPHTTSDGPRSEQARAPQEVRVPRSRLDAPARSAEAGPDDGPPLLAPTLDVALPRPDDERSATVHDVSLEVTGADPEGARFDRIVRHSEVRLVPRRTWRRRHQTAHTERMVKARVAEIRYGDTGEVTGLVLRGPQGQKRPVRVEDPSLRRLVSALPFSDRVFHFGVRRRQLVRIIRLFSHRREGLRHT